MTALLRRCCVFNLHHQQERTKRPANCYTSTTAILYRINQFPTISDGPFNAEIKYSKVTTHYLLDPFFFFFPSSSESPPLSALCLSSAENKFPSALCSEINYGIQLHSPFLALRSSSSQSSPSSERLSAEPESESSSTMINQQKYSDPSKVH